MAKIFKGNQFGLLTPVERFNQKWKFNSNNGCWEWTARRNPKGYGVFQFDGSSRIATRFAFKAFIGRLEPEFLICHKCDNPCCVNPMHLFKGTNMDNFEDAIAKGRKARSPHPSVQTYAHGCRCNECKLAKKEHRKQWKENRIFIAKK